MPTPPISPASLQVVDGVLPAVVARPGVLPDVELQQVDRRARRGSPGCARCTRGCDPAGNTSSSWSRGRTARRGSSAGSWSPTYSRRSGCRLTSSPEHLLAAARRRSPRRCRRSCSPSSHGLVQRGVTGLVVGPGPSAVAAGEAPHAVADLADPPAEPAESTLTHRSLLPGPNSSGCRPSRTGSAAPRGCRPSSPRPGAMPRWTDRVTLPLISPTSRSIASRAARAAGSSHRASYIAAPSPAASRS